MPDLNIQYSILSMASVTYCVVQNLPTGWSQTQTWASWGSGSDLTDRITLTVEQRSPSNTPFCASSGSKAPKPIPHLAMRYCVRRPCPRLKPQSTGTLEVGVLCDLLLSSGTARPILYSAEQAPVMNGHPVPVRRGACTCPSTLAFGWPSHSHIATSSRTRWGRRTPTVLDAGLACHALYTCNDASPRASPMTACSTCLR